MREMTIDHRRLTIAKALRVFCITMVCGLWSMVSFSQERTRILFLLDASLSMKNEWKGGSKWNVATSSLLEIADSISKLPNIEMGLRVFGDLYPEPDKNCRDTRLAIPFDTNNVSKFRRKLEELRPKGITPLVYSIEKAALDFGDEGRKIFSSSLPMVKMPATATRVQLV